MHQLSKLDHELLTELFLQYSNGIGIERMRFRATHPSSISVISTLESEGYILATNDEYRISLMGLAELDTAQAEDLMAVAEKLYTQLQSHYQEKQNELIAIGELANRADVTVVETVRALPFMFETPLYGGQTAGFPNARDASIAVSEPILEFATFHLMVEEKKRLHNASHTAFIFPTSNAQHGNQFVEARQTAQPARPDWFDELKEPLPTVLREIYEAREAGQRVLPVMGVRAVIDVVCTELAGDLATFKAKLEKARTLNLLTPQECDDLAIVFDAGSASSHRGFVMDDDLPDKLIEIMEHFLRTKFRISKIVTEIKSKTPPRRA